MAARSEARLEVEFVGAGTLAQASLNTLLEVPRT